MLRMEKTYFCYIVLLFMLEVLTFHLFHVTLTHNDFSISLWNAYRFLLTLIFKTHGSIWFSFHC